MLPGSCLVTELSRIFCRKLQSRDGKPVNINIKLWVFSKVRLEGVFHTVHRFFHRENRKNPLQTGGLQGVDLLFNRFLHRCGKHFLGYITPVKTASGQRKHAVFRQEHLSLCGGHPLPKPAHPAAARTG